MKTRSVASKNQTLSEDKKKFISELLRKTCDIKKVALNLNVSIGQAFLVCEENGIVAPHSPKNLKMAIGHPKVLYFYITGKKRDPVVNHSILDGQWLKLEDYAHSVLPEAHFTSGDKRDFRYWEVLENGTEILFDKKNVYKLRKSKKKNKSAVYRCKNMYESKCQRVMIVFESKFLFKGKHEKVCFL